MSKASLAQLRVFSLIPPTTQLNTTYPSTAYLTGFLRSREIHAVQKDLALGLMLRLLSAEGLEQVGDTGASLLNLGFFLFPVVAEFDFAAHAPLITGQPLVMFLEAIERGDETAVTHRREAGDADVNTNGRGRDRHRLRDFALGLNTGVPLTANT